MLAYVITPFSAIVVLKMAAAFQWFILVGSVLQYLQTSLFFMPAVRRWANLPPLTPGGSSSPSGPQGPMASMLRNNAAQASWEAPRTIDTTAQVQPEFVKEGKKAFNGLKGAFQSAASKASDHMGKQAVKAQREKAATYESKRALQEKEAFYRRQEEKNIKRQMKGKQ